MSNAIVITNVDSLLGYSLAYRFLEDWNREEPGYSERREATEFRLVCHERQGLEDLELLGGKIFELRDYADKDAMNHIMKNTCYVIFVPENSDRRIEEGESVIHCAKKQNVEYLTMLSYAGLDRMGDSSGNKMKNLKQFLHLEKEVSKTFNKDSYCIVRSTLWHQFFYYFGPMIEDDNQIIFTVDKECKWSMIDLADLVDAVYNLSSEDYDQISSTCSNLGQYYAANLRKKKNITLFEFTGTHKITPKDVIKAASHGLQREGMTYKTVDEEVMYNYLYRIHNDNRFRQRPIQHANDISVSIDRDNANYLARDRPYTFPLGRYLNKNLIQTLIEYWEVVGTGKADIITDQLEKAIHRKPQDVHEFFKNNQDQFRRLR